MLNSISKDFLSYFSVEVTPNIYLKNKEVLNSISKQKRIFIAYIEGSNEEDIINTAKLIRQDGNIPVPHIPARQIKDKKELKNFLDALKSEANVCEVLLIAGSNKKPYGEFESSIQLIETGYFNEGFKTIYFAGHPEGNVDIEKSNISLDASLKLKQDFANNTQTNVVLLTQFCFDSNQIIIWANKLREDGIHLPIEIGVAGPAKLTSLIKYSIDCGVGPSLKILENNFSNLAELATTYSPVDFLNDLIQKINANKDANIQNIHFYPFGGIKELIKYIN
jgi:methylenetetrahydrofolate reductase (NADPH)